MALEDYLDEKYWVSVIFTRPFFRYAKDRNIKESIIEDVVRSCGVKDVKKAISHINGKCHHKVNFYFFQEFLEKMKAVSGDLNFFLNLALKIHQKTTEENLFLLGKMLSYKKTRSKIFSAMKSRLSRDPGGIYDNIPVFSRFTDNTIDPLIVKKRDYGRIIRYNCNPGVVEDIREGFCELSKAVLITVPTICKSDADFAKVIETESMLKNRSHTVYDIDYVLCGSVTGEELEETMSGYARTIEELYSKNEALEKAQSELLKQTKKEKKELRLAEGYRHFNQYSGLCSIGAYAEATRSLKSALNSFRDAFQDQAESGSSSFDMDTVRQDGIAIATILKLEGPELKSFEGFPKSSNTVVRMGEDQLLPGEEGLLLKVYKEEQRYENETKMINFLNKYYKDFFPVYKFSIAPDSLIGGGAGKGALLMGEIKEEGKETPSRTLLDIVKEAKLGRERFELIHPLVNLIGFWQAIAPFHTVREENMLLTEQDYKSFLRSRYKKGSVESEQVIEESGDILHILAQYPHKAVFKDSDLKNTLVPEGRSSKTEKLKYKPIDIDMPRITSPFAVLVKSLGDQRLCDAYEQSRVFEEMCVSELVDAYNRERDVSYREKSMELTDVKEMVDAGIRIYSAVTGCEAFDELTIEEIKGSISKEDKNNLTVWEYVGLIRDKGDLSEKQEYCLKLIEGKIHDKDEALFVSYAEKFFTQSLSKLTKANFDPANPDTNRWLDDGINAIHELKGDRFKKYREKYFKEEEKDVLERWNHLENRMEGIKHDLSNR